MEKIMYLIVEMVKHSHPKEIRDEFSNTNFSNSIIEPIFYQLRTLELRYADGKTGFKKTCPLDFDQ